jgi:hypothetical protein
MARRVLVIEEVISILKTISAPNRIVEAFKTQAENVTELKKEKEYDEVTVASGFGQKSRVGFVELTVNDTRTQMEAKKAREIGLMMIEAAEAAESDQIFIKLLESLGLNNPEAHGRILVDLREIRQGTRGVSFPS